MFSKTSLILGESASQRQVISSILEQSGLFGNIRQAANEREALQALRSEAVAAIFYIVCRPCKRLLGWLRRREQRGSWSDIPFFLITGQGDANARILGFNSGIDDCLTFDISSEEAAARIRRHLMQKRHLAELRRTTEELSRQVMTDPLTGTGNRRYFTLALEAEISRMDRTCEPFSLMTLDIDYFKQVNDTYGHQAGDAVLQMLADNLRDSLRKSDTICRLGGEEFTVIMPGTTASNAQRVAERIRRRIALAHPPQWPQIRVTVSIGVRPVKSPESMNRIVEDADQAMYWAKFRGRNRVEVFPKPLRERACRPGGLERMAAVAGVV